MKTNLEIIEALGYCLDKYDNCDECPYRKNLTDYSCVEMLWDDVLALFKSQQAKICKLEVDVYRAVRDIAEKKAKIEALQMDNNQLQSDIVNANMNADHALAEIERVNHRCIYYSDEEITEYCVDSPCPEHKKVTELKAEIKAEAIKEFAERLIELGGQEWAYEYVSVYDIDNLVKEMVGGADDDHT